MLSLTRPPSTKTARGVGDERENAVELFLRNARDHLLHALRGAPCVIGQVSTIAAEFLGGLKLQGRAPTFPQFCYQLAPEFLVPTKPYLAASRLSLVASRTM